MKLHDSVEIHDRIAEDYAKILMSEESRAYAREIARILPIKDGDVILDIGAGAGRIARGIMEEYDVSKYYAVEPGELFNYFMVKDSRVELLKELGQDLSLPDNCCDVAFAEQVIIHIKNDDIIKEIISEMGRVVKPGGFVALTTTQCFSEVPIKILEILGRKEHYFRTSGKTSVGEDVYAYRRYFSVKEINEFLYDSGMELVRMFPEKHILGIFPYYYHILAQSLK
ncbi:MAG: class I SAM-dependent methyltransferase [Candidatus Hodarchaeales archaeon]